MTSPAAELARRLAREAEAVCRHYLSNGRRCGRYWIVGDVANTPGRSLYVRLHGPSSGKGAAGKWADAATGQVLWSFAANQLWKASPMTYSLDGSQFIAIASGPNVIAFGLK